MVGSHQQSSPSWTDVNRFNMNKRNGRYLLTDFYTSRSSELDYPVYYFHV